MSQTALETARPTRRLMLACCALLFTAGLAQALLAYLWNPWWKGQLALHVAYAAVTGAVILLFGQPRRPLPCPAWAPWAVLGGGLVATLALAQVALQAFPSSADEYGYTYVADTLLHGRLWNRPLPEPLRDVFQTFYVVDRDGKRASQYAPGFPAVLAAFKLVGLPQFANAVVGLLAGVFLWLGLQRLPAPPGARLAALALGTAAPFVLFNDASFFSHSLTAAAVLAVAWLDLRDADAPSPWNRVGIGLAFSVLLTTRYEAFLIAFALFAADSLVRRRARVLAWSLPAAAGALPVAALFLFYNWRITGSPLQTTLTWAFPDLSYGLHAVGVQGRHSAWRGLINTRGWLEEWQDFAAVLLLPLYAVALWRRVAVRAVRWFDLVLPALVVFFFFYPDDGGFQYGPRYWYLGHALLPLTVAAGLPVAGGTWTLGRLRLDPLRVAAAQLAAFAGFTLGYAAFLHVQSDVRLLPARAAASARAPAVVLVGDLQARYVPWQKAATSFLSLDFTRNGVDGLGPVVTGRYLGEARTALLCQQMPDRRVYKVQMTPYPPRSWLVPVCNGAD